MTDFTKKVSDSFQTEWEKLMAEMPDDPRAVFVPAATVYRFRGGSVLEKRELPAHWWIPNHTFEQTVSFVGDDGVPRMAWRGGPGEMPPHDLFDGKQGDEG